MQYTKPNPSDLLIRPLRAGIHLSDTAFLDET